MSDRDFSMQDSAKNDSGRWAGRVGWTTIFAFVVVLGGWAATAPLDAAIVAPGVLVVSGHNQSVQHPEGGVVSSLSVREGDRAERGQILIELGSPELVAESQALLSQMVELQMQRTRLAAELAGNQKLRPPSEWTDLSPEDRAVADSTFQRHNREAGRGVLSSYEARIIGYRDQIQSIDLQTDLLDEELAGMKELFDKGLAPLTRLRAYERSLAELQGQRAELNSLIASTQQERQEESRFVEAQLGEIVPKLAAIRERLEIARLRAPVAGTVVGLTAHTIGGVVRPSEQIMEIVPEDPQMLIEGRVRPQDADNLREGQLAEVRITAFRGTRLPTVHGTIERVSADRFVDERSGQPYFVMQVAVPPEELLQLSENAGSGDLRAGLPADIVVPIRARTVLQYILEPLHQAVWVSLREE